MRILIAIVLALIATDATAATVRQCHKSFKVVDGDTVKCNGRLVRAANYDTPETGKGEFGNKCANPADEAELVKQGRLARSRLVEMIDNGPFTMLYGSGKDRYKRNLARFFVSGRDVSVTLIGENLAKPYHGGAKEWCVAR